MLTSFTSIKIKTLNFWIPAGIPRDIPLGNRAEDVKLPVRGKRRIFSHNQSQGSVKKAV